MNATGTFLYGSVVGRLSLCDGEFVADRPVSDDEGEGGSVRLEWEGNDDWEWGEEH